MSGTEPQTVFRNHLIIGIHVMLGIVGLAASIGGLVTNESAGADLFWAACAVGCAALLVRIVRAGVYLRADGVTVRSLVGTKTVPWTEVRNFEAVPDVGRSVALVVQLRDGRRLKTKGLNARSQTSAFGKDTLEAMRAARANYDRNAVAG